MKAIFAPAIVLAIAVVGAHPFCNLAFHCGCDLFALATHCNIHHAMGPHCPWCVQPIYFLLAFIFAISIASFALVLTRRRPFLLNMFCGILALFGGAVGAALITAAAKTHP